MKYLSNFVDILNDYIAKEDISINEFSKRIGIAERAVAKWMTMQYVPSINSVIKVADFFNCSIDYLFGLSENPTISLSERKEEFITRYDILRSKESLSSYKLAKECNFQQTMVSKWRRGKYPKTETLIKLAEYLGCSIDYLVGRSD